VALTTFDAIVPSASDSMPRIWGRFWSVRGMMISLRSRPRMRAIRWHWCLRVQVKIALLTLVSHLWLVFLFIKGGSEKIQGYFVCLWHVFVIASRTCPSADIGLWCMCRYRNIFYPKHSWAKGKRPELRCFTIVYYFKRMLAMRLERRDSDGEIGRGDEMITITVLHVAHDVSMSSSWHFCNQASNRLCKCLTSLSLQQKIYIRAQAYGHW